MSQESASKASGTPCPPPVTPAPSPAQPEVPVQTPYPQSQQGPTQQGQGQQTTAQDDCPDPSPHHVDYQVDAAAAKKESDLYTADAAAVAKAFAALDGAQAAYAQAKEERKAAFLDLKTRLGGIQKNLACVLDDATRERLKECWEEILNEAATTPPPQCAGVDTWDCGKLPAEIATLRDWMATASACVAQVDAEFDRLAGLPKTLGGRVTDLGGKAAKLEAEVCGPRTDPERSYVEYLQLAEDFRLLDQDWIDPVAYVCALRKLFVTLVKRHTLSICLQVAVLRWDKRKELEEAAKGAKVKNLVDLVLECSRQPQQSQNGASTTPSGGGQASGEQQLATVE